MTNAEIGHRVHLLRARAGYSLDQLAERAGMSKSYLSRLETGEVSNPRLFDLMKTARGLGVPTSDLLPTDEAGLESILEELQGDPDLTILFSQIGKKVKGKALTPGERRLLLANLKTIVDTLYADDD
jgi:transcriptional regulator with XRE-family HTH domain